MYFTDTPSLNHMEAIMKQPPGYLSEAAAKTAAHTNIRKKTATADFVFTTEKRTAVLFRYALCLISGFPAAQPLFVKPSNPHFRR